MSKFSQFAAACAAALVGFSAFGELTPKSWNGGASGDWGVAANWEPAGVPTADDAVTIGSGVVTASNLTVSVGSLTMGSGATLTVYAEAVDNSEDLTAFAGDGAVVNVAGDLALQSGAWIVPIAEPVSGGTVRFNVGGNVSIAEGGCSAQENDRTKDWISRARTRQRRPLPDDRNALLSSF